MTNTRPQALPVVIEGIPATLRAIPRWVTWKHHWSVKRQKWVKLPCNPNGGAAAVDRPETWSDFDTTYDTYDLAGGFDGIGFVFTGDDDIVGGDFDKCFDPDTGELSDLVAGALDSIGGYWEQSPSGKGLHFITRAALEKARKNDAKGIELYNKGRFFTVTGRVFNGHRDLSSEPEDLQPFIDLHFPAKALAKVVARPVEVSPEGNFFKNVNAAAMQTLGAWVPALFPEVAEYRQGYRVASVSLGRDLEEDISIVPEGIVDFGVADMGDPREGKRTPIDLVIEWASTGDDTSKLSPREAAFWICDKLNKSPSDFGWKQSGANRNGYRARTEFGNAERMLDRYGAGLMYVPEINCWFKWSGVHWQSVNTIELEHMAKETIRALPDEVADLETDEERLEFFKFCAACQKASMVSSMIRLASSDPRVMVPVAELDKHVHLLGVGNGTIDLRSGELVEPEKEHRITIVTTVPYAPANKAPLFEQTVHDVFFGDKEQIDFFRRLIGYSLLGQPKEDVLAIPYGSGSNGKSTVLGAIREMLGAHAKSASAETFLASGGPRGGSAGGPREDVLRLRGARFVYVGEPEEGSELREGLIKSMTGGDPIPARGIHAKTTIEVMPTWVAFMPTNHKPIVKGDDHAIWRRLLPVPFTRNFDQDKTLKKDPHRADKLLAEAAGILSWAVRGAIEYQKNGFNPPKVVSDARDAYKSDMDLLADWIEERCELGNDKKASSEDLWLSWRAYAEQRGELRLIPTSRGLGRRLSARGFLPVRDVSGLAGRGFAGICMKSDIDLNVGGLC